jgi:hypothetical protein
MNIQPYDIILIKKDNTLLSRLISWFTRSNYNHIAIVSEDMCGDIYYVWDMNFGNPLRKLGIDSWSEDRIEVYRVPILNNEQKYRINHYCMKHEGIMEYDWAEAINFPLFQTKYAKICLSFVKKSFSSAGIKLCKGKLTFNKVAFSKDLVRIK